MFKRMVQILLDKPARFTGRLARFTQLVGTISLAFLAVYGLMGLVNNSAAAWAQGPEVADVPPSALSLESSAVSVPLVMNYQGDVKDAEGNPLDGSYDMSFRIYSDVVASTPLWQEQYQNVRVRAGHFSVLLGNTTALPETLFSEPDRFIGVTVHPYSEMVPRQRLASVPYAMQASLLDGQPAHVLVPPGTVVAYAGENVPDGWLLCDGSTVSRLEYPDLFAAIGTVHGEGNRVTTFHLPDYRGRFLRGVNAGTSRDPDSTSRTAANSGGNSGDAVGSVQQDATARPNTPFTTNTTGEHSHLSPTWNGQAGPYETAYTWGDYDYGAQAAPTTSSGSHSHTIAGGGDNETRPTNAYVNWIIKK